MTNPNKAPATPLLAISSRMLRSPSHESVTTDLSLFSVSSLAASDAPNKSHRLITFKEHRGPSPKPDLKSLLSKRQPDIPEIMWFEEGNDLIRSCAAISSALGLQKSFSTGDITLLPPNRDGTSIQQQQMQHAMSEIQLNSLKNCGYLLDHSRLDYTSRSCSTWVAVGELASTSQLPSPHGDCSGSGGQLLNAQQSQPPVFTTADLIRSVNKKVRQNYIRRRLLTTYKAIERLSQSEFNLDRLEAAAIAAAATITSAKTSNPGPTELIVPTLSSASAAAVVAPVMPKNENITKLYDNLTISNDDIVVGDGNCSQDVCTSDGKIIDNNMVTANISGVGGGIIKKNKTSKIVITPGLKNQITMNLSENLTMNDIEKERGIPLSRFERNMMIFNWLHSLDETSIVEDVA